MNNPIGKIFLSGGTVKEVKKEILVITRPEFPTAGFWEAANQLMRDNENVEIKMYGYDKRY